LKSGLIKKKSSMMEHEHSLMIRSSKVDVFVQP
jgi:hypothetical protein